MAYSKIRKNRTPMPLVGTGKELSIFLRRIEAAIAGLPIQKIPLAKKKEAAGHLFFRQLELTDETVLALSYFSKYFPDLAHLAPAIRDTQQSANGWLSLANFLDAFAVECKAHYVQAQAGANKMCKEVLDKVLAARDLELANLDHEGRLESLKPAFRALVSAKRPPTSKSKPKPKPKSKPKSKVTTEENAAELAALLRGR